MSAPIQGQLLRRNPRRETALFLHRGRLWVVDFVGGEGEILDAATWVRFNCSDVSRANSCAAGSEYASSLSPALAERLELLLDAAEAAGDEPALDDRSSAGWRDD